MKRLFFVFMALFLTNSASFALEQNRLAETIQQCTPRQADSDFQKYLTSNCTDSRGVFFEIKRLSKGKSPKDAEQFLADLQDFLEKRNLSLCNIKNCWNDALHFIIFAEESFDSDLVLLFLRAAHKKSKDIFYRLLRQTSSVNISEYYTLRANRTYKGGTLLHWAAACGELNLVRYILQNTKDFPELLSILDRTGRTPFQVAADIGGYETVKIFIEELGCKVLPAKL